MPNVNPKLSHTPELAKHAASRATLPDAAASTKTASQKRMPAVSPRLTPVQERQQNNAFDGGHRDALPGNVQPILARIGTVLPSTIESTDQHGGADLGPDALNLSTTANALLNGAMQAALEIHGLKSTISFLQSQPETGVLIGLCQKRISDIRSQFPLSLAAHEAYLDSLRNHNEQYAHVNGKADKAFLQVFANHFTKDDDQAAALSDRTLFFPGSSDGIAAAFRFIKAQAQARGEALPKLAPSFTTSYGGYPEAAEGLGFEQISRLSERTQGNGPVVMPIVNPNNPLGEYEEPADLIEKFINPLPENSIVIIDESGLDWVHGEREKSFFNPTHLNTLETAKAKGIQIFVVKSLTKITNSLGDPRGGIVSCLDNETAQRFKQEQCPQYHSPAALAFYQKFYEKYDDIAGQTQRICKTLNPQLRQDIGKAVQALNEELGSNLLVAFSGVESMPYLCVKIGQTMKTDQETGVRHQETQLLEPVDTSERQLISPQVGYHNLQGNSKLSAEVYKQCEKDKISIRNLSDSYYNRNDSGPYNARGTMDGVLRVRVCTDKAAQAFCQSLKEGLRRGLEDD